MTVSVRNVREPASQDRPAPVDELPRGVATFSVIIPTHNRARLVCEAIESVLRQEPCGADVEIIVVDDDSTDDTAAVVASYPSVRYVRTRQLTAAGSRNVGLENARGEWMAFLDDDDVWLPHKLRECHRLISEHRDSRFIFSAATICDHELRPHTTWEAPAPAGNQSPYHLFLEQVVTPSVVVIHREVFEQIGLFDPSVPRAEDRDMWLRTIAAGYLYASTSEPLALYREAERIDGEQTYQNYATTMTVIQRFFLNYPSLRPSWARRQRIFLRTRGFYVYYLLVAARQAARDRQWHKAGRFFGLAFGISPWHLARNYRLLAGSVG